MAMKRFGFQKFVKRPKTEEDWARLYRQHRYEFKNIKSLSLQYSCKGPGQTGARYFAAYFVPPIKYWNPNIEYKFFKDQEKPIPALLETELNDGKVVKIDINGKKDKDILQELYNLDNGVKDSNDKK